MMKRFALLLALAVPASAQTYDQNGSLQVGVRSSQGTAATAAWTSATALDTALTVNITGYGGAALSFSPTGSITAGTISFEISHNGGTTWHPALALESGAFTSYTTYALNGATARLWSIPAAGATHARVRLNPVIAGAGTANLRLQASSAGAIVRAGVDGTVAATQSGAWTVTGPLTDTQLRATPVPVSGTVTAIGTITANQGTPNTTANRWPVQITDGTDLALVSAAGAIAVDGSGVTQPVSGTFWQATQPVSAASLPLPTGASTLAEQQTQTTALQLIDNLPLAQGSTTSGQSGTLVQGAVTTSAPTYVTAQTSPLSLTTAGALRTDSSAVTQPVSGTVTANAGSGTFTTDPSDRDARMLGRVKIHDGTDTALVSAAGALLVDATATTQPVSGPLTDAQLRATAVPISGTVTVGTFPDNEPINVSQLAGTALAVPFDADTGVGTQNLQGVSFRKGASGGSVEAGTSADPLRVDPTGTTTQPVSGTVTANIGTFPDNEPINVAQMNGVAVSMGAGVTGAGVQRVVLPTDQSAVPVTGTFWQATQPVSGTVTANAGTGTFTVGQGTAANLKAQVQGEAASGAAKAGNPVQVGGVFNTTQPTVTTGQAVEAQATARGALIVAPGVDGFAVSGTVTATGPLTDAQLRATPVPVSGTVTVTDGAGALNVIMDSGTVTANAGTNLNTSALALEASLVKLPLAQGSTTSGQSGALVQGAVTTGAPTYTTAQTNPLSLTTAGALRVDGSAVTQPVSGTFWQATQPVSGTVTVTDGAGALNVIVDSGTTAATQSGTWTVQPGNTANTTPWLVKAQRAATSAITSVAASATNVTCLASNANRLGGSIYNDSTADVFIKLGATASSTSFTAKVFQDGYFIIPHGYTGIVDCVWQSATGSARVSEVSP